VILYAASCEGFKKRLSLEDVMKHPWIKKNAGPSGSCIKQREVKKAKVNDK